MVIKGEKSSEQAGAGTIIKGVRHWPYMQLTRFYRWQPIWSPKPTEVIPECREKKKVKPVSKTPESTSLQR